MKALIFTMTCGEGHNAISRSLAQELESRGIESKIVQTYFYSDRRVAFENKRFLWACKHIPRLYDFFWEKARKTRRRNGRLPGYVRRCPKYFLSEINSFKPDIILCAHSNASAVLSYLIDKKQIDPKIVSGTILFDFCLAPFWEDSTNVDFLFRPADVCNNELNEKGFTEKQIITSGLSIRKEYFESLNAADCKKSLGLPEQFTLLIMGGGYGLGNTLKLVKSLIRSGIDQHIVVINGKNKKNFAKLQRFISKNNIKNITNLSFVDNADKYMKAADVIISRGGSSTLCQALALKKPLILREKLILNEKINKSLLIERGCALGMNKISDAPILVQKIKNNKDLQTKMAENDEIFMVRNGGENIITTCINEAISRKKISKN